MALGCSIKLTVTPYQEFERNEQQMRMRDKIHGSEAIDELLALLKTLQETNPALAASFLGYFTTWHDTFLRWYVKQRLNTVWLYIITFLESRYAKTFPYHTYCVAVGLDHLDHTPVLKWFSEQMEGLMKGNTVYCGRRKSCVGVKNRGV